MISTSREKMLYTVDEAAEMLSLPRTWLYERTRKNAVPCHRYGKYVRFTPGDLQAIIDGQKLEEAR